MNYRSRRTSVDFLQRSFAAADHFVFLRPCRSQRPIAKLGLTTAFLRRLWSFDDAVEGAVSSDRAIFLPPHQSSDTNKHIMDI